jgi:hypothetical protein
LAAFRLGSLLTIDWRVMAKRTTFTVEKAGDGWRAIKAGGSTVTEGATKADVVRQTVRLAKTEESASIKIKGRRGKIPEEVTYPRRSGPPGTKG